MNKYLLKTKHGMTPDQLRIQFYETQHRRCVICENELELADLNTVIDTPSRKVLCRKCGMLVRAIRLARGAQLDRAIELVKEYKQNNNKN